VTFGKEGFQIQTSTFSAQYGIGGAVFNQISKGGTNGFHGLRISPKQLLQRREHL
jgi:hypothetical protein